MMLNEPTRIDLYSAHKIISECPVIMLDDETLVVPEIYPLTDESDNVFLAFALLIDDVAHDFSFREGKNLDIPVEEYTMFLKEDKDEEAQYTEMKLLFPKKLD
jgi:hypothetical protein